jgi:hypothetical protein
MSEITLKWLLTPFVMAFAIYLHISGLSSYLILPTLWTLLGYGLLSLVHAPSEMKLCFAVITPLFLLIYERTPLHLVFQATADMLVLAPPVVWFLVLISLGYGYFKFNDIRN